MTDHPTPQHVRRSALELLEAKVTREGGSLLYLEGARYGLVTSVFEAEIVPGSGPRPHTHAYAEFFVLHEGQGRYFVDEQSFDAEAGDIVIVPPKTRHSFVNTGTGPLRHTAIHEAPAQAATFPDGSGNL
jgi:mannose-6-phosphate isomerase-like protein (cupin superfamily)